MPSNNKAYLGEVKEGTSGSQKNGYKGKKFWSIFGIDADDDRHIRVRIPEVPGHRNFESWKPIIDAIQKGYLVEITGFHYMIGKYKKRKIGEPDKEFPDNIHGDAFTEHHATYRLIDKDNNYVEPESLEKKLQPPSFNDLFDHPYEID